MTLSRWLRDYLYIPLGGSRHGVRQTYRNLMLTMVIGGLWHGAAMTFLVWGAIHGGYLAVERVREAAVGGRPPAPRAARRALTAVLQWLLTFNVVCLAWIFFRAESIGTAFEVIGGIVGRDPARRAGHRPAPRDDRARCWPASSCRPRVVERGQVRFTTLGPGLQIACLAGALTVIDVLGPDGVAPFIYFRF